MVGRLVEIEGVDPSKREEVLGIMRERIIPGLKEIDGFAGFISLIDEENRRARSVVLWETKEGADEAERQFAAKREEIVRGAGGSRRSPRDTCSRAAATDRSTASTSTPRWWGTYGPSRRAAFSSWRSHPGRFARPAWYQATATCTSPWRKSRSSCGAARHSSSSSSCAAKNSPAAISSTPRASPICGACHATRGPGASLPFRR